MDTRELERTRQAWDEIAAGYDRFVTPTGDWALPEDGLSRAGLRSGMRFLDVASGSGALSIPAARRGAQVLAVDLSPQMIERLGARARGEGLTNLEGREMDGHALELEDDIFDVSASQFGVMLFPDLPQALREMVRVTKPGGHVLIIAYGPPAEVEFLGFFMAAMQAVLPDFEGLPMDPPPLPFQIADPETLRQRLTEAGLRGVRVESGTETLAFDSGTHMWNWVTNSNPIGTAMVADLTGEQTSEVQEVLDRMLREQSGGGLGGVLKAQVNIGIGTK